MDQARLFTKCTVHRPESDLSSSRGVTAPAPQCALPVHGRVEDVTGSPGSLSMPTLEVPPVAQPSMREAFSRVGKHVTGRFATALDGEPWNWPRVFGT
ncbi:MAG: hypothetical protein EB058_02235 [Proteobacteria bacterium]|nr:hypothetical protein [Pseudomonadota bacterium]